MRGKRIRMKSRLKMFLGREIRMKLVKKRNLEKKK
jgi:hypothetical protein